MANIPNVTFADKSDAQVSPLPDTQKLTAAEIQQIKDSINAIQNQFQNTEFLYLGEPSTDGTVRAMKTSDGFELALRVSGSYTTQAVFGSAGIEFMENLTIPPQTLSLGEDGYQISSAAQAAVVTDTSNRTAFLLTQLFTQNDGTSALNAPLFTGEQELTLQSLKDVNSAVDPVFTYTVSATGSEVRRHTRALTFESPDTGTASVVLRQTNASGPIIREMENVAVTANTEVTVSFLPMCLEVGTVLHVTVTGGIRLKGTGSFNPFLRITTHLGFNDQIATTSSVAAVVGPRLLNGMNMNIVTDTVANTITFNATTSGGPTPPAPADIIYYGLSNSNNPDTVDTGTLTEEQNPTNPDTISTGTATAGQYFILLVPQADDITSIFDTVLSQDVTNLFTITNNVRTINTVSYKSYVIGPLNAGVDEEYIINFGS